MANVVSEDTTERAKPAGADSRRVSGVSRRRLLGLGGAAGLALAAAGPLVAVGRAQASDEAAEPVRIRQWAMVIDLRNCDGCMDQAVPPQCTQYCIWGHSVPEGQQWLQVYQPEVLAGLPDRDIHFLPMPCQQCENSPCTNACPVGATFHTPEGMVLIDQQRCIGCRLCMAACPYDRRFFNWSDPVQLASVKNSEYSVWHETPAIRGTVMKCNFCPERTAAGGVPFCVEACPHGAIYFGDLEEDIATNGDEVVELSRFIDENEAFRYKEELGTKPRVWYIAGHVESADVRDGAEREFPANDGRVFRGDELEWPWRRIVAATEEKV